MREWEEHQRKEGRQKSSPETKQPRPILTTFPQTGKQVDHSFAKEMIAGFAGAEVDRLAETKGADFVDREEARRQARDNAHQLYDQQYGQDQYYDPNQRQPHERIQESFESRNGEFGRTCGDVIVADVLTSMQATGKSWEFTFPP